MTKSKRIIHFCLIYFISYLTTSVGYCLLVTYLNDLMVAPSQRSIALSIGSILAMLLQTSVGYLCDKTKKIKPYVIIIMLMLGALTYLVYVGKTNVITTLLVYVTLFYMVWKISTAVIDTWALEASETIREHYGTIRAFGSIGWTVGSFTIGILVNKYGYQILGLLGLGSALLTILVCLFTKDAIKHSSEKIKISDVKVLLTNKKYVMVVIILLFLSLIADSHSYVVIGKLNTFSSDSSVVSNYWAYSAIYELPLMFLGFKLYQKFEKNTLLMISCVGYILKFVLYALAINYKQMYLVSMLQGICYPILELVGKRMINDETPLELKSTGLLLAISIYSCVSSLISPLFCAVLEENMSYNMSLYVIALLGVLTLSLVGFKIKMDKR